MTKVPMYIESLVHKLSVLYNSTVPPTLLASADDDGDDDDDDDDDVDIDVVELLFGTRCNDGFGTNPFKLYIAGRLTFNNNSLGIFRFTAKLIVSVSVCAACSINIRRFVSLFAVSNCDETLLLSLFVR